MTLHQLAIFDAVARHRGYTRAAQELRLTQPAVSAQVGQLEREFSLALFERTRRQTGLTDAGRQMHAYAQRLFALVDELQTAMRDLRQLKGGRVTLATVSTAGAYVVPLCSGRSGRAIPGSSSASRSRTGPPCSSGSPRTSST